MTLRNICGVRPAIRATAAAALFGLALAVATPAAAQQELTSIAELATVKATIVSVDTAKRKLTLKGADGQTRVVKVGPQVQNFAQIKAGDVVVVAFYQAMATDFREPGKGGPSMTTIDLAAVAPKGALPAGTIVETTVVTFEVVGIEPENNDLILADLNGNLQTVQLLDAKSQAMLSKINVGDKYDVVVTDALAVSIQPAK
jgi:ribosomal protein S1